MEGQDADSQGGTGDAYMKVCYLVNLFCLAVSELVPISKSKSF